MMKPILSAVLGCMASLCLQASASASVATVPTEPESFTGTYAPLDAQSDGALLFGATLPAAYGGQFVPGERSLFTTAPAGTPSVYSATVDVPIGATNMHASVFSVYDTTDDFVTLVLDDAVATSSLDEDFSTVFATDGYNNETTLETAIVDDNVQYLKGFFDTYVSDFPVVTGTTATGTLVDFSAGALGGTATLDFTPAPEPSTWAALCVGGGSLLLLRRRRTAKA